MSNLTGVTREQKRLQTDSHESIENFNPDKSTREERKLRQYFERLKQKQEGSGGASSATITTPKRNTTTTTDSNAFEDDELDNDDGVQHTVLHKAKKKKPTSTSATGGGGAAMVAAPRLTLHSPVPSSPTAMFNQQTANASNARDSKLWLAEQIVDSKIVNGEQVYRVRWYKDGSDGDTWEPAKNIFSQHLISDYYYWDFHCEW